MLGHCQQEHVAAVGPKLLDKKKKILSAGQILGGDRIINDVYVGLPSHYYGYMHRASTQIAYQTLNEHCVLIKKCAYDEVGGFDCRFSTLKWAMADLFLSMGEAGYRNVYNPYVEVQGKNVQKKESQTLSNEADVRLLKEKHIQLGMPDGNYNPNLSIAKADYTLDV